MTDGGRKEITVNDLSFILSEFYGVGAVNIESVEVADMTTQHHPDTMEVGVGGVLNVRFTYFKKEDKPLFFFKVNCPLNKGFCRKDCINCVEYEAEFYCEYFERIITTKEET